jgi:hypothetical protein
MNATPPSSWRRNLIATHTIRRWGDAEVLSVTSKLPGIPRRLVVRAPISARCLVDDVVRRHLVPAHALVPQLVAYGSDDTEVWALLDTAATLDLSAVPAESELHHDAQHIAALADLVEEARQAVGHRTRDVPERWCAGNLLLDTQGQLHLLLLDAPAESGDPVETRELLDRVFGAPPKTGREGSALVLDRLQRALAQAIAPRSTDPLIVRNGGRQVVLPCGRALDFRRSPVSRGIVTALAEAHRDRPGKPITTEQLIAATWPGERLIPHSARNRLWVAISRLRQLGLEGTLLHEQEGYLFPTELEVVLNPA